MLQSGKGILSCGEYSTLSSMAVPFTLDEMTPWGSSKICPACTTPSEVRIGTTKR